MNRQISYVALATLILLASLIAVTTYWQMWRSADLAARQDNGAAQLAQFKVKRGFIFAADGKTILAGRVRRKIKGNTVYLRTYPTGGFASQAIGYSTPTRERTGLEDSQNGYLTGSTQSVGDLLNHSLTGATYTGDNVTTTLLVGAQKTAETELQGKCGAAVAWNYKTGAVYVMASNPTYNPNLMLQPGGYTKIAATPSPCPPEAASPFLNRTTQGLFTPGSTFKTITASAALESGEYTIDSTFNDPGYCTVYGTKVYNNGNPDENGFEARGNVTLLQAYQYSINAVFCQIGQELGAKVILDQAKKFGFYSVPPLDTPADSRAASGLYLNHEPAYPRNPDGIDAGRLAFGQINMLVTPLQMAMVAGAIGNGGVVMRPHLVKVIKSPDGSVINRIKPRRYSTAVSPETATDLTAMMEAVVSGGTGTAAQIPGYSVAGKTGTAETGVPNVYTAWFIFFIPGENIAGAVVLEDQLNGFGGSVAAPIAKDIMEAILDVTSKQGTS